MDLRVDWLSFTFKQKLGPANGDELIKLYKNKLGSMHDGTAKRNLASQAFTRTTARKFYDLCMVNEDNGVRVYGGRGQDHILVEMSGRGCCKLGSLTDARDFISQIAGRCTRIDFAVDSECDTDPVDFTDQRGNSHFQSVSTIRSKSGTTVYVGSPKSHRYMRCYRYSEPHPRANLLRCEFVFRKRLARTAAANFVAQTDDATFTASLGNTWALEHEEWQPGSMTQLKIKAPALSHTDEDTITWIYTAVIPALRRMTSEGKITMDEIVQAVG